MGKQTYKPFDKIKGLTRNQKKGLILEYANSRALQILGIRHSHNSFDSNYAFQIGGVDLKDKEFSVEDKNVCSKYWWSDYWIKTHIINRFKNIRSKYKFLVCSFFRGSSSQYEYLVGRGIRIIEVGFQVTISNLGKAINKLVKGFYWLLHKLRDTVIPLSSTKVVSDGVKVVTTDRVTRVTKLTDYLVVDTEVLGCLVDSVKVEYG